MNGAYGRANGDVLLAPERDARTGHRVPAGQSRRDKHRRGPRGRGRPLATALVAGAIVIAVGVGVAVAASGGNGSKNKPVAGGTNPTVTTGPGTPGAGPGGQTADLVTVAYRQEPSVVTNIGLYKNLGAFEIAPPLEFECRANGCALLVKGDSFFEGDELDIKSGAVDTQPAAGGHWQVVRRGTRSACSGTSHTTVGTWDLTAVGTRDGFGITVPARITGTFAFTGTAEVNGGSNVCNAATNIRINYDSASSDIVPNGQTGSIPPINGGDDAIGVG